MMKRTVVVFLGLAAVLFLSIPSHAQGNHGASSAANHGPNGMSATHANNGSNGNGGKDSIDAGKKTPDQLLSQNTKLSDNLSKLLPTGVTAQQACNGFKNLGQCVAAIHVSHNLGLDFNALKCDMTGKADTPTAACPTNTSSKKLSLGQAIDTLKPGTDSKSESETAMKQARQDIKGSSSGS
jgi:hypothetical protein